MRSAFIRTLAELAERDSRIALLTADLGFMALEPFSERFPDRFLNVGVAEQNMLGVATGMAEAGYIPFTYSIATFASLRPFEFFRNGAVFHQLPVRLVGVGAGFEYGSNGPSHHAVEDIAVMRSLPGLTIISPADPAQASAALRETWDLPGPVYYRLGKDDRKSVVGLDGRFSLGRLEIPREGKDLLLVATGAICADVMEAAGKLQTQDVECTVAVVGSIAPPPLADLVTLLPRFRAVVSVEAHSVHGGLGSLVAEVIADQAMKCRLARCGVRHLSGGHSGSEAYFNRLHGLSSEDIVRTARELLSAQASLVRG